MTVLFNFFNPVTHHGSPKWLLENQKHNGPPCAFCKRGIPKRRTCGVYMFFHLEKAYDTSWKSGILKDQKVSDVFRSAKTLSGLPS